MTRVPTTASTAGCIGDTFDTCATLLVLGNVLDLLAVLVVEAALVLGVVLLENVVLALEVTAFDVVFVEPEPAVTNTMLLASGVSREVQYHLPLAKEKD
jgi:hypothetical protein